MANSENDAGTAAGGTPRRGYGLPNQAAPLPRQWQMQPHPGPPSMRMQQQFHPNVRVAGDWSLPPPARRMERAILAGLWLLVMLAAIAIGLRLLDLSALSVAPMEAAQRAGAAFGADDAARAAAYATLRMNDDPIFDDPSPAPLPSRLSAPSPGALPPAAVAAAQPEVGLAASAIPSTDEPDLAAAPPAITQRTRASAPCPDALRAMQLCPEQDL